MRYTTIIDISQVPEVYKNKNARLVYLHMVLACGYHDADRDALDMSVRQLAAATGTTISATRHALKVLQHAQLIARDGEKWRIRKWLLDGPITPRKKANTASSASLTSQLIERTEREHKEELEAFYRNVKAMSVPELEEWRTEFYKEGQRTLGGHLYYNTERFTEWLDDYIKRRIAWEKRREKQTEKDKEQ